ncbi:MAG: DUF763 domain-containing protein [Terriglobia bacterium]|nr:DUF763 domain-containing protein [Terriglobia bacterium]
MRAVFSETIVQECGASEFQMRLRDPFQFQALGCVTGRNCHVSGIAASVMGTLSRAIASPLEMSGF